MRLLDGPFKHLEGVWIFEPLGDAACKVSLNLDFEFSSKIIGLTLGPIFNKIANSLVDAFIQRANSVYA
jgi:ribosome-associated toxin RatA of RatAB toxin-antitoxin module